MVLPQTCTPIPLFWGLVALAGMSLLYLLWREPIAYVTIATASMLGLPMTGEWALAGSWVATAMMALAALRWWLLVLQGQMHWRSGYGWAILFTVLWIAWGMVAAASSPEPWVSAKPAVQIAALVLGAIACGHWIAQAPAARNNWIVLCTLGLACLAIRNWMLFPTLSKAAPMPYWLDANFFSAGLVIMVPLLLWRITQAATLPPMRKRIFRVVGLVLLLAFLATIGHFNSRGAWLSLAVTAAIMPLFFWKGRKFRRFWIVGIVAFAAILILVLPNIKSAHSPQTRNRIPQTIDRLQSIGDTQEFSNRERLMRWTCAWRMAYSKPVVGHGPGRFAPLFKNFLQDRHETAQIAYWFGWRFGAHSDGLTVLAETGFPGFLLFLLMLGAWGWAALRPGQMEFLPTHFRCAVFSALLTWLVHGQFNDLLGSACIATWVFVLLGMLSAQAPTSAHSIPAEENEMLPV